MKITKIAIRNIHSLKGNHEIDFEQEPLASAGLFAITGPTGAGKSTILDAITLALYNKIPRIGTFSRNEMEVYGSVVTHDMNDAHVLIEYISGTKKYRSSWFIEKNSKGNWKDYEMEISEQPGSNILESKKSEVPRLNEKIIGLNYDQFRKSILLAQGEFAQFLKADENERARLLMDLTGSHIYQRLGMAAFEKNKSFSLALNDLEIQLNTIPVLQEEREIWIQNTRESLDKKVNIFNQKVSKLTQKLHAFSEYDKLQTERSEIEKAEAGRTMMQAHIQEQKQKLNRHQALTMYQDAIQTWKFAGEEIKKIEETIADWKSKLSSLKEDHSKTLDIISNLTGENINMETAVQRVGSLENHYFLSLEKLEKIKEEGEHESQQLDKIKGLLPDNQKQWINSIRGTDKASDERFDNKWKELEGFEINEAEPLRLWLDDNRKKLFLLEKKVSSLDFIRKEILRVDELKKTIKARELHLKQESKKLENLEQQLKKQEDIIANHEASKEKKWDIENVKNLRKSLIPGDPCPLCGSTNHPYTEHEEVMHYLDFNLRHDEEKGKLKEIQSIHQKTRDLFYKNKGSLETDYQILTTKTAEITSLLESEKTKDPTRDYESKFAEMQGLEKEITIKEDALNNIRFKQCLSHVKKIRELRNRYSELKEKNSGIYSGDQPKHFFQELKNKLERFQTETISLESLRDNTSMQLETKKKDYALNEGTLLNQLKTLSYESISSAIVDILPLESARKIESEIREWEIKGIEFTTKLKNNADKIQALTQKEGPLPFEEKTRAESELSQVTTDRDQCMIQLGELKNELSQNEKNKARRLELQTQCKGLQQEAEVWADLQDLIGDREGKKFSKFAQNLTLQHLITYTNKRMSKLTDRYQLDYTRIDEDLFVQDLYQAGVRRSVKTLSGGESFIVSLALALSLSDMASSKVKIESLFIDEGFGTLDQDTLDLAMETIEKLQDESNRVIGIISHVESLKDRIYTQIQVVKNPSGFSSLLVKTI